MDRQLHPHEPSVPWHTTYLTVTALGIGLLGGISRFAPQLWNGFELAPAGLVVGMFTVTSLLYWYDVTDDPRP